MSRIRTIKPEFFTDEEIAACTPLARLLFVGLWTLADRDGRLEDRPARIKVQTLPYDQVDADDLLAELERGRFVIRYEVDGRRYLQIRTFGDHQRPNLREPASTIPPVPGTFVPVSGTLEHVSARVRTCDAVPRTCRNAREGEREGEGERESLQAADELDLPCIQSKKSPTPTAWRLTDAAAAELGAPYGMSPAEVLEVARDYAAKVAAGERKPYTVAGVRGGLVEWVRQVAERRHNGARRPAAARVGLGGTRTGGFNPGDVQAFGKAAEWPEYVEDMLARPPGELVRFEEWRDQHKAPAP